MRFFGTAAFDDRRSEADETGFVDCILVKQRGRWDYLKGDPFVHSFFVLFLEPTGLNDHEYRRIGMGQLLQCFEFERGAKTRITIV